MLTHELRGALLVVAPDLTDEHDSLGLGVGLEELETLEKTDAVDGVAAHADDRRLTAAGLGELVDDLVGEGPRAGDQAHGSGSEHVGRHDAGAAAPRRDQPRPLSLIHISEPTRLGMISY